MGLSSSSGVCLPRVLEAGAVVFAAACALGAAGGAGLGAPARAATLTAQVPPVSARGAAQPPDHLGHLNLAAHPLTCGDLLVVVQSAGSPATVREVSCSQGSSLGTAPVSAIAGINQPAVVALSQSGAAGTDCRITLGKSGSTVVLAVRQEPCGARSGNVTASVVSGGAVLNGTATGAAARSAPGIVWFTLQ